jgi:hypothetical protein
LLGNIRAKDLIIFDLLFNEIWLEVEMTLQCEDRFFTISFDLKVETDSFINELKHILIKMGIKSWMKYIIDNDEKPDKYLFYHFSIDFMSKDREKEREREKDLQKYIELDNFHEKIKDRFNFEGKIKCKLEFINFNEIVYKELTGVNSEKEQQQSSKFSKYDLHKKKILKNVIYEFLEKFFVFNHMDHGLLKVGYYKNVIWKCSIDDTVFIY